MADVTVKVLEPADSYALLTIDELKAAFGITDSSQDTQLQMLIDQYSDVVATMCNRVFAKEKVIETWRGDPAPYDNARVFLTHYPVADADIESVAAPDGTPIDPASYEIENRSGKLSLRNGAAAASFVITYTGGYELPDEAPPALKAATQLLVQAARSQLVRGTSNLRSVQHGQTQVSYFDPNAAGRDGSTPVSIAGDTVQNLLTSYMRFQV